MESSTTIRRMLADKTIIVPSYQRAYSWDTPQRNEYRGTQTDVFLADLEKYSQSNAKSPYYFGHFLFEEKDNVYRVIDGQQRLTTITIFLCALFRKLHEIRPPIEEEQMSYEDMIKRRSIVRFSTVDYDNQPFIDYVIDQTKVDRNCLDTASAIRIADAFDYFKCRISCQSLLYITKMISIISESNCTTHLVQDESEAIQMFIFQNNRGKPPSNLEILKAQFMYNVHLHGADAKGALLKEIKNRFESIYKSISSIEYHINEDEVLLYTMRVYFNSLWEGKSLEKIEKLLTDGDPIAFIKEFTQSLSKSFEDLSIFFGKDEQESFAVHSLVTLGGIGIAIPFILKAYRFGLPLEEIGSLCAQLEILVLRDRLIGTRADITSRINEVFTNFNAGNRSIAPIIKRVDLLKTTSDWWWAYWNNDRLRESIQGYVPPGIAKFLLWKYESSLERQGKKGYSPSRFDRIISPELEHIAPTTEPGVKPHGYDDYDDEFRNRYLNSLGNYLLLSKSHNCAVGNIPLEEKLATYTHNEQQREVRSLVAQGEVWSRGRIQARRDKIIEVIMSEC